MLRRVLSALALLAAPMVAQADTITQTGEIQLQKTELVNASFSSVDPVKFNSALGTLIKATLRLEYDGRSTITLTNNALTTTTAKATTGIDFALTSSDSGINGLIGSALDATASGTTGSQTLASGETKTFGPIDFTNTSLATYTSSSDLANFLGNGTESLGFLVNTLTGISISGGGGNIGSDQTTLAGAKIVVTYEYNAVPEPASITLASIAGLCGLGIAYRRRVKAA